jgi:hypothetical protein
VTEVDEPLCVEVVFALPDRQELVSLQLPNGATVEDAIERSALQSVFPEWNLGECEVGVWGQPAERSRLLEQGDRVEIYRPLRIDPRQARRALAAQGKSMGKSAAAPDADPRGTEED